MPALYAKRLPAAIGCTWRDKFTGCTLKLVMRTIFACVLMATFVLVGCHSGPKLGAASAASPNYKVYHLRGKVISTNSGTGEVTLDHEAIPGFMEAMTMPFKLKDARTLGELHPGDTITAEVLVGHDSDATVLLDHIVVVAQVKPNYKPKALYHVPSPGDPVPDSALRNQDGRRIHREKLRDTTLLISFIYTRCPPPNFCPLVTRNFATINRQLQAPLAHVLADIIPGRSCSSGNRPMQS